MFEGYEVMVNSEELVGTTQCLDGVYKVLSKLVPLQLGSTVVVLLCAGNNYDFLQFYLLPSPRLLCSGYWGSFWGVKWPGHGVEHPSPFSAEIKKG